MRTVYLAGPINGCTDAEATEWRAAVHAELATRYVILDPMRRDYRGQEDLHVAAIVAQDLADIRDSDVILVYALRPSWGTAMEVVYAQQWGKEVLVVCPPPVSPWLKAHATLAISRLTDAIRYLRGAA